jgi:hypothetical protein
MGSSGKGAVELHVHAISADGASVLTERTDLAVSIATVRGLLGTVVPAARAKPPNGGRRVVERAAMTGGD